MGTDVPFSAWHPHTLFVHSQELLLFDLEEDFSMLPAVPLSRRRFSPCVSTRAASSVFEGKFPPLPLLCVSRSLPSPSQILGS